MLMIFLERPIDCYANLQCLLMCRLIMMEQQQMVYSKYLQGTEDMVQNAFFLFFFAEFLGKCYWQ